MSRKRKGQQRSEGAPKRKDNASPETLSGAEALHTAGTQTGPGDQETNSEERKFWREQVQQARRLNTISSIAAGIAFLALLGLAYNAVLVHRQVDEMRRANRINAEAFQATERPWLSVDVKPAGDLIFVHGKQAVLAIKVSIKNVGKSIAKDIQVNARLFPTSPSLPVSTDAAQNEHKVCDHPKPEPVAWFDLFPTDHPVDRVLDISALPRAIDGKSVAYPGPSPRAFVGLYVTGCVSYRFSLGKEIFQTRFAYRITGDQITTPNSKLLMLPNGMPLIMGFEVGVKVPEKKLHLTPELLGNNEAD